jgi:Tol biopolymer transport system component
VPAALEGLVERCLAKEPGARFADGAELLAALQQAGNVTASIRSPLAQTLEGTAARTPPPPPRWRLLGVTRTVTAAAIVAVGAVAIGAVALHRRAAVASAPDGAGDAKLAASAPPLVYGERMVGGGRANNGWAYAISPDGSRIVFDDGTGVWLQSLPSGGRTPLPIPSSAVDSIVGVDFVGRETVAYVVSPRESHTADLWVLGVNDGAPRRVRTDAIGVENAAVSPDGKHVAYVTRAGLHVGAVDGPTPKRILSTGDHEFVTSLSWSPANDGLVYLSGKYSDRSSAIGWVNADGSEMREVTREGGFVGNYGGDGIALASTDRLLALRYDRSTTTLVEIPLGADHARAGASRVLFRWDGATISEVKVGGERIAFARSSPNGAVISFDLSADGRKVEGAPRSILESAWVLRPLGFVDDTHVAVLEEQEDFFHVVSVSTEKGGAVEPYVKGPLSTASLLPNGDVLYWTKPDGGACTLHRHLKADGSDRPAPMAGTSCDKPILCVKTRCVALEESEDIVSTFRDWDPETGATGAPLAREHETSVRFAVSPDGRFLAAAWGKEWITLYDLAHGGAPSRIETNVPRMPQAITFTPDGKRLVFVGYGSAGPDSSGFAIATTDLDGAPVTLVTDPVKWSNGPRVARDGRSFIVGRKDFGANLWVLEAQ